jgi:hypothetical protein
VLRKLFADIDLENDKIITSCGSGVTASIIYVALESLVRYRNCLNSFREQNTSPSTMVAGLSTQKTPVPKSSSPFEPPWPYVYPYFKRPPFLFEI